MEPFINGRDIMFGISVILDNKKSRIYYFCGFVGNRLWDIRSGPVSGFLEKKFMSHD